MDDSRVDPYGGEVLQLARSHHVSADLVRHLLRLVGPERRRLEAALAERARDPFRTVGTSA